MSDSPVNKNNDLIIGRNAVIEAMRAGREIDSIIIARGERSGSIGKILAMAKEKGIVVKDADSKKLDFMCGHSNHQGVAAYAAFHSYSEMEDVFGLAESRGEKPFIIICDELEDPHNLGAIIRTAEAAGAHGIIIPKRRSVSLSFAVGKVSAGALEYMPVVRVGNMAQTIEQLKEKGLWIYGADTVGQNWCDCDYRGSMALVIGSEGKGIGRLIREKCDFMVSLPMRGEISSLNASVAAGIIIYEAARQRMGLGKSPC